jgi:hypothetical protein
MANNSTSDLRQSSLQWISISMAPGQEFANSFISMYVTMSLKEVPHVYPE